MNRKINIHLIFMPILSVRDELQLRNCCLHTLELKALARYLKINGRMMKETSAH